jgi:hypothetical protein
MTIGIDQNRMRVGLFKPNRQQSKCYLNESVGGFGPGLVSTPTIIKRKTIAALKKIFKN